MITAGSPTDTERPLPQPVTAIADEVAGAAELAGGKTAGVPVAVVRGLGDFVLGRDFAIGNRARPRPPTASDLFSRHGRGAGRGSPSGALHRRTIRSFTAEPVASELIEKAIEAAIASPHLTTQLRGGSW